jgi:hypothetical protein
MSADVSVASLSCFEGGLSFNYSENSKVNEYNIRQLKAYTYSSLRVSFTRVPPRLKLDRVLQKRMCLLFAYHSWWYIMYQILIFAWSRFKNFNVANILLNKILYHNFFITTVKNNNISVRYSKNFFVKVVVFNLNLYHFRV